LKAVLGQNRTFSDFFAAKNSQELAKHSWGRSTKQRTVKKVSKNCQNQDHKPTSVFAEFRFCQIVYIIKGS
jgi:hypothetical protein